MKKLAFVTAVALGLPSCVVYGAPLLDCTLLTKKSGRTCNPFSVKLIHSEGVKYQADNKSPIVVKTLPIPTKETIKVLSMPEFLEKYLHLNVEDSMRFRGKDMNLSESNTSTTDKGHRDIGIYTVKSGDVFSKIAAKFGFTTKILLALNHFDNKDTLQIGEKVKIPLSQHIIDAISSAKYTIQKGDTLLGIAHLFDIDVEMLMQFNKLHSKSIIREGKELKLPLPYVLKKIEIEKKRIAAKKEKALKEKKKRQLLEKKAKDKRIKALISNKKLYIRNGKFGRHKLRVTATAYSSHRRQTDSTPFLAAWNNRLRPGMKIIAVSRDLLSRYGLRNGTKVKISGLPGYYRVRDKMNKRFRKRIDIYMGVNRRKALRWGRRSVVIYW